MLNVLKQFVNNEDGLEMVEWAVVAAVITAAGAGAMAAVGADVGAALTALQTITGAL